MITTLARLITRLQDDNDGLFIGSLLKGGKDYFKPNTVYEIRDIMGTLTIVEVGQGSGAGPRNCASPKLHENGTTFSWNMKVGNIVEDEQKHLFLTLDEKKEFYSEKSG